MSRAHPTDPTARGRVLIAGRSPLADRVDETLEGRAIRVENLFEAIGEVTVAPAADPVTAVLVTADLLARTGAGATTALRQVDPGLRLVLLDDSGGLGDEHADDFELVIHRPPAPEAVDLIIRGEPCDDGNDDDRLAIAHEGGDPGHARAHDDPVEKDAAAALLGDVDLVEQCLRDPAQLTEMALALVRQQTGWTDLRLETDGDGGGALVAFGGERIGLLRSDGADESALREWAGWLARWITLARTHAEYRHKAFRDDLTAAWNRRFYYAFMTEALARSRRRRRPITVMVFDIDNFKQFNDEYGHEAGDVILVETVSLLQSVIRQGDRVCRIGGDEFAVVFADEEGPREVGSTHPESVETIARRFQDQIANMKFPKLGLEAPARLSISAGLATYPWDGLDADALLRHADRLALRSKRHGKNAIMYGGTE